MNEKQLLEILDKQRNYYQSGATKSLTFRQQMLKRLKSAILYHEKDLQKALQEDLGKSEAESYMCEIGLALSELSWMQKHLKQLMQVKTVPTPLAQFAARSFRSPSPYGTVLIMSPWNYPVLLTLEPLIDALAAGNTVVVKPSAYAPATSALLKELLSLCFPSRYVAVITGGRAENEALLKQHFDKIFFTGSAQVGRLVLKSAAQNLTPVTLELGGKSPCIVEKTAKIDLAARRIVFGKFLNCGQTCVAPDYILCDQSIQDALISAIWQEIIRQFGPDPLANPNYGKIINEKHFRRIVKLISPSKVVWGGHYDQKTLRIAPTVMKNITWEDAVMGEEIFGPVLPVISFRTLNEAVSMIEDHPHPLALYLFTQSRSVQKEILSRCHFGGGCINDTIIHLATSAMPFGGVGESGIGSYHGRAGFETFSHTRSIVEKKTWMDLPIRYQPYSALKMQLLKLFLK